jgi:hypothetical protein
MAIVDQPDWLEFPIMILLDLFEQATDFSGDEDA